MKMRLLYKFEDQEKAQLLNDYFCSIATLDNDNKDIPYMTDRGPGILTEIIVTELDINDIISCLDPQKASGPDDISHRMLIATKNTICRPLCKLFNLSLRKKCFPSFWKLANVITVCKKSDKSIASNNRPISLLSCVSKNFERTVFKYVFNHISRHKYIHKLQSGFLPGYSTTHHTDGICRLFADDASLGHTSNDIQNLHDIVNSDLSNIKK
jgi:hypothetical protein